MFMLYLCVCLSLVFLLLLSALCQQLMVGKVLYKSTLFTPILYLVSDGLGAYPQERSRPEQGISHLASGFAMRVLPERAVLTVGL